MPTHHSNLKEHLVEAAKDQSQHLYERQRSMQQNQMLFESRRRSHTVRQDVLPTTDEIQKFKQYTEAEKQRLSKAKEVSESNRLIVSPRHRSNSNVNGSAAGSPRNRKRTKMTGFFEKRQSAGGRRSITN